MKFTTKSNVCRKIILHMKSMRRYEIHRQNINIFSRIINLFENINYQKQKFSLKIQIRATKIELLMMGIFHHIHYPRRDTLIHIAQPMTCALERLSKAFKPD